MNLELFDADNKSITWYLAGTNQLGDEQRISIAIVQSPTGGLPKPAKLRYYSLVRTTSQVAFEFKNVPMP